jgi:hypothetical protein
MPDLLGIQRIVNGLVDEDFASSAEKESIKIIETGRLLFLDMTFMACRNEQASGEATDQSEKGLTHEVKLLISDGGIRHGQGYPGLIVSFAPYCHRNVRWNRI